MKNLLIFVFAFFTIALFIGCASTIQYQINTPNSQVNADLTLYNTEELNAATKQIGTLITISDTTLSAPDRALQLMYITNMKDRDIQILAPYGHYGYFGYKGSSQETKNMEIEAIIKYQQYKQKQK